MNINRINPLYFFLVSLLFILMLNITFYFFYKQKAVAPIMTREDIQFVNFDNLSSGQVLASSSLSLPKISNNDYILGSEKAAIEMIIYDDPTGGFSLEYFPRVKILKNEFINDIKVALRLFPLNMNKYSKESCLSVICVGEQGKYFEGYEEILRANQGRKINKEYLFNLANVLNLDDEKFKICLVKEETEIKLDNWIEEAENAYIIGVPITFINNSPYLGAYQLDDFVDSAGFKREGLRTIVNQLRIEN